MTTVESTESQSASPANGTENGAESDQSHGSSPLPYAFPTETPNLALVVFGGLGDVVLFSPVVYHLRQIYPNSTITMIVEHRSRTVTALIAGVDRVEPIQVQGVAKWKVFTGLLDKLKHQNFDGVLSCGSNPFIALLLKLSGIPVRVGYETGRWTQRFLTHPAPLNTKQYASPMYFSLATALTGVVPATVPRPHFSMEWVNHHYPTPSWLSELLENLEQAQCPEGSKRVLIHPGVSKASLEKHILKQWSVDNWVDLIRNLAKKHQVLLVGGPDDTETIESILQKLPDPENMSNFWNVTGKPHSLLELAQLIEHTDCLVCVDSAPMHLAIALDHPTVAIFGPTDPEKLLPPNQPHMKAVTVRDLPCQPCLWEHRSDSCDRPLCLDVPLSKVLEATKKILTPRT